ncbi:MAG TPA: class I SAM-dependent methyltransferase [Verrucomicrobiae bacterium]|nr:class I SAM-dependent methyltransferase [Verrucomicrobiae bacterium]
MNRPESKFVEPRVNRRPRSAVQAATAAARRVAARERDAHLNDDLQERAAQIAPYLTKRFGLHFRGRILEIGAGAAWLSAELSKLPGVVEIIATDLSGRRLKEEAPRVFARVGAREDKITRIAGDLHELDFPASHFDFVVCASVLNRTVNIGETLREARRVLKPGGWFVAVREPVKPWLKFQSQETSEARVRSGRRLYSRDDYERFFAAAGLEVEFKRVSLSSGMKFFFNQMFNGLTHARYALLARKPARPANVPKPSRKKP